MVLLNKKMLYLINQILRQNYSIDDQLVKLVSGGFLLANDCYVLNSFYENNKHIQISNFVDKTGYECFINSFHVDDYVKDDFLIQSILFANLLFQEWNNRLRTDNNLEIIISTTDFGANIRFHVMRDDEVWIDDSDLDKFDEGILICREL